MCPLYKKRLRFEGFDYKGIYRYFVTMCTEKKQPLFTDTTTTQTCIAILKDISQRCGFKVWAYCFMPNHFHCLIEGMHEGSDMKAFIAAYKQKTAFLYKQAKHTRLWQINYYERILRKDEETRAVARYIFENPVRKGLVIYYTDYPFLGSFENEIELFTY